MEARRTDQLWKLVVASFVWFSLPASSVDAGLQSALRLLKKYDEFIQSDYPVVFVSPAAGNDAGRDHSFGPSLWYDPATGHVQARIPAAVLNVGDPDWPYAKLYSICVVTFNASLSNDSAQVLNQFSYTWSGVGPLSETHGFWKFDGENFSYPGNSGPIGSLGSVVAATMDLGNALTAGLTIEQVRQSLSLNDDVVGFVDYMNHRGVPTLRVPMVLNVVPEPSSIAITATAIIVWANCIRGAHRSRRTQSQLFLPRFLRPLTAQRCGATEDP